MKRLSTLPCLIVGRAAVAAAHGPESGGGTVAGHAVREYMVPAATTSILIVTIALVWIAYTHYRTRNA